MPEKQGSWNPARVLHALGRIGYHPVSAILDIVDNSVSAEARQVAIIVKTQAESREAGRPRAVLDSFTVIDTTIVPHFFICEIKNPGFMRVLRDAMLAGMDR